MHLKVDISTDASKMKMLYKIGDGYEEEKFYGLALARVVNLPEQVINTAAQVSTFLHERNEARKSNAKALAVARKRKLVLTLREQLLHAKRGNMSPENLRRWLQKLQEEFLVRMSAINEEARAVDEQQHGEIMETDDSSVSEARESTVPNSDSNPGHDGWAQQSIRAVTAPARAELGRKELSKHGLPEGELMIEQELVESVKTPAVTIKRQRLISHPFVTPSHPSIKLEPRQRHWAGGEMKEDPIDVDDDD